MSESRNESLRARWRAIDAALAAACSALPVPAFTERDAPRMKSLDAFREYADANEWGLAFDALSSVAERHRAGRACRRHLRTAKSLLDAEEPASH